MIVGFELPILLSFTILGWWSVAKHMRPENQLARCELSGVR
jgi:hypothetical protein